MIHVIVLTVALLLGHHHGHPVHAPVTVNYSLTPCAPGHPPVSPDFGACIGTAFIAS
jgi:hypothetical protein